MGKTQKTGCLPVETRKLYYEDCYLWVFSARVESCARTEKGWEVILDATAFYPEGGGQACDLGVLGGVNVLDVQERGGEIVHLCDGPLTVGETVEGRICAQRRFDLMQQHAGEHILSGIIHKRYGHHNSGFHVGKDVMEVDFDGPVPAGDLAEIEEQANRAVWENVALRCWVPGPEELPNVFYRTKKALSWPVRVVQIPGWDSCACCGVHVARTGEIGLIKILSCVKFHGGVRLELVCGGRAYRYVSKVCEQNRQVSQAFSAPMTETGEAAKRMNETLSQQKQTIAGLEKRLYQAIAERYANQSSPVHFEPGLNGAGVRDLADKIAAVCGTALVLSGEEGRCSFCLISRREDASALGKALLGKLQGRGGGKREAFQGTLQATADEVRAAWKTVSQR